jgi:methionine salvage enolase-phosphatase E1
MPGHGIQTASTDQLQVAVNRPAVVLLELDSLLVEAFKLKVHQCFAGVFERYLSDNWTDPKVYQLATRLVVHADLDRLFDELHSDMLGHNPKKEDLLEYVASYIRYLFGTANKQFPDALSNLMDIVLLEQYSKDVIQTEVDERAYHQLVGWKEAGIGLFLATNDYSSAAMRTFLGKTNMGDIGTLFGGLIDKSDAGGQLYAEESVGRILDHLNSVARVRPQEILFITRSALMAKATKAASAGVLIQLGESNRAQVEQHAAATANVRIVENLADIDFN